MTTPTQALKLAIDTQDAIRNFVGSHGQENTATFLLLEADRALSAARLALAQPQPSAPSVEPAAAAILGAVARGWCHPKTSDRVMNPDLAIAIAAEVSALYNGIAPTAQAPQPNDVLARVLRCRYPVEKSIHHSGFGWDTPRLNEVVADLSGAAPLMANGLTSQAATASVAGLGEQQERAAALLDGFDSRIETAEMNGDMYDAGYLKAMRAKFRELLDAAGITLATAPAAKGEAL